MEEKLLSIPNYTMKPTPDPNLQRFVDRRGNWTHYWNIKEGKFKPAVSHILHLGYSKGPRFHDYLLRVSKEESQEILERAGEEGTRVHQAITDLIKGIKVTKETKYQDKRKGGRQEVMNDKEWNCLETFTNFASDFNPEWIKQEFALDSNDFERGFAGTSDFACTLLVPADCKAFPKEVRGERVLMLPLDWKTSSGIWFEYECQVAAYNRAIIEREKFPEFVEKYKGKIFTGVVRFGTRHKKGYEIVAFDEKQTQENFLRFEAAYRIFLREEPKFEPKVRQIPTEFQIEVPKALI